MGSLAHLVPAPRPPHAEPARVDEHALDVAHRLLRATAHERAHALLDDTREAARLVAAGAGSSQAATDLAATAFVADVVSELAARADLGPEDTLRAADVVADALRVPGEAAAFTLYERVAGSPRLLELPPSAAAEIQLSLLLHLGIAEGLGVWQSDGGELRPLLVLGAELPLGRARTAARSALRGKASLFAVGQRGLYAVPLRRFGAPIGALVAQPAAGGPERGRAYLATAATALGPVLERELLLDRGAERELVLTQALEKRLMRIGFDLHDGPVQDVLALGAELSLLSHQVYPFVLESHRELTAGRFDDLVARVSEIDASLRELAHALESRSVTSRPLGETLHRMIDEFTKRSDIAASFDVSGDPESLTAAQRIAVFRALQESLTNIREHSGAASVQVALRARRHSIDVRVTDDGHGFDVDRALARAAQRGRLGLVGMGERVRMLGGSFDIESRPGGPTTLRFSLPRVTPG